LNYTRMPIESCSKNYCSTWLYHCPVLFIIFNSAIRSTFSVFFIKADPTAPGGHVEPAHLT